ncbi:cysteine-rich CWC family protein [Acidovorax radicis]|uniref:cysteine-rich CWC family protein n=1 Tax=Acidovorax radicis TaxID=758826 RepID=UPI0009D986F3|nr:cysteine-rich CWC family protein [Acidovorax radicis]
MTSCSLNAADAAAASVCPLCGQANLCAIAAGQPAESCWCMAPHTIAPAALAALPPEQRGKTCICPACGSSGGQPPPQQPASI